MKSLLILAFMKLVKTRNPKPKIQISSMGQNPKVASRWMLRGWRLAFGVCCGTFAFSILSSHAYPPAPPHMLYGIVRNQWGDPIDVAGAEVFIETTNGVGIAAFIVASKEPGVNYRMSVPMDSGTTLDLYQMTALRERQNFQLKVQIGTITYLPLEMTLGSPELGEPGGGTRLDLTLGEDLDGDGLPDDWEQAIIALLGGDLSSITPDGDADGDGLSNMDEYLAGTYAFDPNDGFALTLLELDEGNANLEFLAVRGRTYSIQMSTNLKDWFPVAFRALNQDSTGTLQNDYLSTSSQILRVEIPNLTGAGNKHFFKALVQ